jgi:uncharacterized RDD family membrane protein YckC
MDTPHPLDPAAPLDAAPTHDHPPPDHPPEPGVSLWRRLGALLYDGLLLFGLLTLATAILIVPYGLFIGHHYPDGNLFYLTLLRLYLLAVIAGFYVYFWTHGGQTLGMRSWRLRVVRTNGAPLRAADGWRRFGWAVVSLLPAGLGLWWCLIDPEHLAWHDRRSGTRLVLVPRRG